MSDIAPRSGSPLRPLPAFLQPTTTLNLSRNLFEAMGTVLGSVFKASIATPTSGKLRTAFFLEKQTQTNWCWASVAVAVNRFLGKPAVTQCQVVQKTRHPAGINCCQSPGSDPCNTAERISLALAAINVTRLSAPAQPQSQLGIEEIRSDIARDRPVICAMGGGGTNHFVVIVAWAILNGDPWVFVDDPAVGGRKERALSSFKTDFDGRQFIQATRLQ